MASLQRPSPQPQPRTYKVSLRSVLSLPFRICNPPPAVGKVRSCGVTPLLKVRLEDVLDRKHLPPLGLKDFEEWLLYVEMSAENLYFTLWFKEYTAKYNQWAAQSKTEREDAAEYRINWSVHSSSHLAMFYARAKQTFFTPNSEYELNLPSSLLAPFHVSNGSPHPDPAVFTEVVIETRKMLQESLRRFVAAQMNNVGNNRVLCGIIAGITFCLLGSVPPIVVNFTHGNSRWLRLLALPGMWVGLTIFLAAFNGICMGVYVFGDLRQLRKFELARPTISKPQPLHTHRRRPVISFPISGLPPAPVDTLSRPVIVPPPPAHLHNTHSLSRTLSLSSNSSSESSGSASSSAYAAAAEVAIQISPAYYDFDPVDGPATCPVVPESNYPFPAKLPEYEGVDSFTTTASFIHAYDTYADDESDFDSVKHSPEEQQPVSAFDFDALPPRSIPTLARRPNKTEGDIIDHNVQFPPDSTQSPKAFLARLQSNCTIKRWLPVTHATPEKPVNNSSAEKLRTPGSSFDSPALAPLDLPRKYRKRVEPSEQLVRQKYKLTRAVPAFASLTRVLSPVIVRGQWEIVIRSTIVSFLISWIVLGSLLAVPVIR